MLNIWQTVRRQLFRRAVSLTGVLIALALLYLSGFWRQVELGFAHALVIAGLAAILYWLVVPQTLRPALLLVISLAVLILEGATARFILLALLLVLMTQTAATSGVKTGTPPSSGLASASLFYLFCFALYLLVAASQSSELAFPARPYLFLLLGLVGSFFVLEVLRRKPADQAARLKDWTAHLGRSVGLNFAGSSIRLLLWGMGILIGAGLLALVVLPINIPAISWARNLLSLPLLTRAALIALALAALSILAQAEKVAFRRWLGYGTVVVLLLSFLALKSGGALLQGLAGWVGFSYFTFRLLHVLLDSFKGLHTDATPLETLVYALFFPALLIGPIDRLPRFLKDMRSNPQPFRWSLAVEGVTRILIGGVKKFFIADILLVHLLPGPDLIPSISTASAWIRLYSFALYVFFDFSGFTDIAIGTGRLLGYALPENFNAPYLKANLAQFWQSWHITLSTWLRFYVFSPLSRRLLRTRLGHHPLLVVFCAQMITMLLIGLWHGITINFALWGLWHGTGLFVHKVYADRTRRWQLRLQQKPVTARMLSILSNLATFHFVALGWAFFMFPDPADSAALLLRLFGLPG